MESYVVVHAFLTVVDQNSSERICEALIKFCGIGKDSFPVFERMEEP